MSDYNYRDAILKALSDGEDHWHLYYELDQECLERRRAFNRDLEALIQDGLVKNLSSDYDEPKYRLLPPALPTEDKS